MDRRAVLNALGTAGILGLAGCSGTGLKSGGGSQGSNTSTNTSGGGQGSISSTTPIGPPAPPSKAYLKMESVTPTDITSQMTSSVPSSISNRTDYFPTLIRNGSATVQFTPDSNKPQPLPTNRPITYRSTVYNLTRSVTKQQTGVGCAITFKPVSSPDPNDVINFSALPAVDRQKLTNAGFGEAPSQNMNIETTVGYTKNETAKSALIPSPTKPVIEWNGQNSTRISVSCRNNTVSTYQYTATNLGSAVQYGTRIRSKYGFTLSGLSNAASDIVSTAIKTNKGYHVKRIQKIPKAFSSLTQRFRTHRPVAPLGGSAPSGEYIVSYQGSTYWTTLRIRDIGTMQSG